MGKESLALRLEGKMGAGQSRKGGSQTQVKLKHFWGGKLGTVWDGRRTEEQVWGDLRSKGEDMRMEEPRRNRGVPEPGIGTSRLVIRTRAGKWGLGRDTWRLSPAPKLLGPQRDQSQDAMA